MTLRLSAMLALLLIACAPVGAQTTADATMPSIARAPVQYPSSAVSAGQEGTVVVAGEVDVSGRPRDARIQKSSGYPQLDKAALQSISQWSFRPAMQDGKPVAQHFVVPVVFHMERNAGSIASPPDAIAITGALLGLLGSLVWIIGFAWSVVLAKRSSILWLSCMVALWIVTYPVFVAMHWSDAKRNLAVVLVGAFLFSLGRYFMASR